MFTELLMRHTRRMRKLRSPGAVVAEVVVLAGLVVSTWWLFLGSDTTYQFDANGIASGPYQAPQVLECVAVLALLSVAGAVLLPVWATIVTVTAAFTAAWSINAASKDVTGLWAVGAIGVLLGTLALSCLGGYLSGYTRAATR